MKQFCFSIHCVLTDTQDSFLYCGFSYPGSHSPVSLRFLPLPQRKFKSLHFKSGNFKWTLQVLIMAIYMRYSYKQTSGQNLHLNWCRSLYMLCELLALNKDWLLTPSSTPLFVLLSIHTICFNGFRARSKCRAPCVQDAGTEGGRRWPRSSRSSWFGQKDKLANEVTIYRNSMSPHWL